MKTLTKLVLGTLRREQLKAPEHHAVSNILLPPPNKSDGIRIMDALQRRQSQREFSPEAIGEQTLADIAWAACGINRPKEGGRTAPSAMNAQEVDLYLAMASGLYLYEPRQHLLRLVVAKDVRRVAGYQDFVDNAPLNLVYVADHSRMSLVPASKRSQYCAVCAGAMAQNVALYSASAGLHNVVRTWFNRRSLAEAMRLDSDHQILLTQSVGRCSTDG